MVSRPDETVPTVWNCSTKHAEPTSVAGMDRLRVSLNHQRSPAAAATRHVEYGGENWTVRKSDAVKT